MHGSCDLSVHDGLQKLKTPPQITTFIKRQQERAKQCLHSQRPQAALSNAVLPEGPDRLSADDFIATTYALTSSTGHCMDHINFAAASTATAQLWSKAQQNSSLVSEACALS